MEGAFSCDLYQQRRGVGRARHHRLREKFWTDANGEIKLHEQGKRLYPGEYTITEVEPAPGFQMKEPTTQTVILHGGESKTVTFQNEPLNAIVVENTTA